MTRRFCNKCGVQISDAEAWSLSVTPAYGSGPSYRAKQLFTTDLCETCVEPAAQVVREAVLA